MFVVNISHDNLIITEFNGKRFVFRRNIPVEISPEMYQNILLSGHISAAEIVPYEKTKELTEKVAIETVVNKIFKKAQKEFYSKGKRRK